MSQRQMRVGIVQAAAVPGDVDRNLAVLERWVGEAAKQGADVVVTPELFATGYDPATAWTHDAEQIRGHLARVARRAGVGLVASTVDHAGDRSHISASFFDPDDGEIGRVRKRHLYGATERQYFAPGDDYGLPVDWRGLRWGLGICYDVEFPEFARAQARHGAQALLVPTAVPVLDDPGPLPRDGEATAPEDRYSATLTSTLQVPSRALENGLYIAYANHAGEGFTGYSCIATPAGRHAVLMDASTEGVAVAPIKAAMVEHARGLNTYLEDLGR
jgi:predicted amidohydrolase